MSLKFFTDTHISKQVAIQLNAMTVDVLRCQDVGLEDASDEELLVYAVTHERAILSKDDDFLTLHSRWRIIEQNHFGIFYCPYRDRSTIGLIVTVCKEYHTLSSGVGTLEATLVGHHGTSKIMSSEKSVSKRESHLIKKDIKNEVIYIT